VSSAEALPLVSIGERVPPPVFFVISAVFHYLGPAFAVLLFQHVPPLGVAWLRIGSAAIIFVVWRRPWLCLRQLSAPQKATIVTLGTVLAAMNSAFYEAIDRLPLATVGAIEFLGPIALAVVGLRTRRNVMALALAAAGVFALTNVRIAGQPLGYFFAFANCALFVLYVVLGHRLAADGGAGGVDRLSIAMLVAMVVALPIGGTQATAALASPLLLAAAIGVGISSSVIPYVCDQMAMARLPRATFALMLSLLPATAAVIGVLVLRQIPSFTEVCGIALVILGIAVHRSIAKHPGSRDRERPTENEEWQKHD
jgi:inner membrane transporter RhtA